MFKKYKQYTIDDVFKKNIYIFVEKNQCNPLLKIFQLNYFFSPAQVFTAWMKAQQRRGLLTAKRRMTAPAASLGLDLAELEDEDDEE